MDDVQPNNLTTAQGAERIKAILEPQPQTDQAEAPEVSDGILQQETPEGQDGEQVEPESDGDLYEVVVEGKKFQVPLEELIKGYQLEAHYTHKSQKLAEDRKALEGERSILSGVSQRFEQLNDVVTYLQEANSLLEATLPPEPDLALADQNPAEYIKRSKMREQALRNLGVIQHRMNHTKAQAQQAVAELQQYGAAVIQQKMPELLTPDGRQNLYSYLTTNYGYSVDDVNKNVDPNLFIMAEKARRWDEMQSKTLRPDYVKSKAVKDKPKAINRVQTGQHQQAMTAFKKNPTERNAAQAIKAILNK